VHRPLSLDPPTAELCARFGVGQSTAGADQLLVGSINAAPLVENLERRHLNKPQRDEWTKRLVDLRAKAMQGDPQEELNDKLSLNSSEELKSHPKTKVEGAKRGRPVTAEARAKKEIAAQTGQSVRNVQRATSTKPKGEPAPQRL
jgi:hypothetical protein